MADNMSKSSRSFTMSRIRSKGNASTEIAMIDVFQKYSIEGWVSHQEMVGKPDFIFPDKKLAVFVDGCFWHGCPRCFIAPKSNVDYWINKIAKNKARDRKINKELKQEGWTVIRVWEHSLRRPKWIAKKILGHLA